MKTKTNKTENLNRVQTYLSFELNKDTFAANVKNVINILEMKEITQVPQSPDYLKGVINLRGNVLPIVDLRVKFGMPDVEFLRDTCILVLQINDKDEEIILGAIVDSVKEVLEIEEASIEPAPSIGTKYHPEFINGMWKIDEHFIMILNIENVFTSDETLVIKELN